MSYEITQYSTHLFSANEALGFHSHILGETSVLPEATTGKLLAEYRSAAEKLKVLLKNNQGDLTMDELVKAADKRRDEAYANGLAYLNAMVKSSTEEVAEAALTIKAVYDKFPDIRKANNNTESGILGNLIEDISALDKSVHKQAGFTPWFQELESAQEAFVEAVHNRMEAGATKIGTDIRTAKLNCENAYKALVKRVNAIAEIDGENKDFDPTFINHVNSFIESVKASKAAKSTKKTVKSDEEESVDAEDSEASAPVETPSVSVDASTEEPKAE